VLLIILVAAKFSYGGIFEAKGSETPSNLHIILSGRFSKTKRYVAEIQVQVQIQVEISEPGPDPKLEHASNLDYPKSEENATPHYST
jgi:hypothetical protein